MRTAGFSATFIVTLVDAWTIPHKALWWKPPLGPVRIPLTDRPAFFSWRFRGVPAIGPDGAHTAQLRSVMFCGMGAANRGRTRFASAPLPQ